MRVPKTGRAGMPIERHRPTKSSAMSALRPEKWPPSIIAATLPVPQPLPNGSRTVFSTTQS